MPSDRPDPGEFFEMAQRMLRELFGDLRTEDDPWAEATRRARESFGRERTGTGRRHREPSAEEQRENLTFALATRAVEALEDLALNVAAIRQRLERMSEQTADAPAESESRRPADGDATGEEPDPGARGSGG